MSNIPSEQEPSSPQSKKKEKITNDNWNNDDFITIDDACSEEEAVETNEGPSNSPSTDNNTTHNGRRQYILLEEPSQVLPQQLAPKLEIAPWMEGYLHATTPTTIFYEKIRLDSIRPLVRLHNEIIQFVNLIAPREEEKKMREYLIKKFKSFAMKTFRGYKCNVQVFGSQATGLFLPESDIDIVISLKMNQKNANNRDGEIKESAAAKEKREMHEWESDLQTKHQSFRMDDEISPLNYLANALRENWKDELSYLEVVNKTRVPIVKFTHAPTNISMDVCFEQEGGPESATTMIKFLRDLPPLRHLCYVLKYFTKVREINEPYHGGVGSFMLQLMIVSFLQHKARCEYNLRRKELNMNLGALLLEFFELYGLEFNYCTTGISVLRDGSYFPKGAKDKREHFWNPTRSNLLAIENPNDPTSDVGRSTFRMNIIQRSFDVAFRVLLGHVADPYSSRNDNGTPNSNSNAISILACIIPISDELKNRAALFNNVANGNHKRVLTSKTSSDSGSDMMISRSGSSSSDGYESNRASKFSRFSLLGHSSARSRNY